MASIEDRLARRGGAIELLRAPAALFGVGAIVRSALYNRGWLPRARTEVPVISVGNITAGGTGKTPFVLLLIEEMQRRGWRPGVLARGYGRAKGEELNDEGKLLAERFPGLPQVQNPDRVAGAEQLLEGEVDVILLDDGFQHRRLGRDLDFVLVDATRPFGLAASEPDGEPVVAMLPRGLLREPPSALRRADGLVITRADAVSTEELDALQQRLQHIAPGQPQIVTRHAPRGLRRLLGGQVELGALRGQKLQPLCAIGHPGAFVAALEALGAQCLPARIFPDHHGYQASDLAGLEGSDAVVVTTAKDAVKLRSLAIETEVWILDIDLEVQAGTSVFEALLDSLPDPPGAAARAAIHAGLSG